MDVRNQKASVETRDRVNRAFQLRLAGLEYAEIAEKLGYSDESGPRHAIDKLLTRVEHEGAEALRRVEGRRLDRVQAGIWAAAVSGDLDAIKVFLRISERRAKLFGLDAPARVSVAGDGLSDTEWAEKVAELITSLSESPDGLQTALAGGRTAGKVAAALEASTSMAPTASGPKPVEIIDAESWSNLG